MILNAVLSLQVLLIFASNYESVASDQNENVVKLSLFYESLCPACMEFIVGQLYPAAEKITSDYLEIEFVPYGNAQRKKVNDTWQITCQHGQPECYGNKIEACVVANSSHTRKQKLDFVHCLETEDPSSTYWAKKCADNNDLSWDQISECANGEKGTALLVQYGVQTDSLRPRHKYVPWILFNGVYNATLENRALNNLFQVVCDILNNRPPACSEIVYFVLL